MANSALFLLAATLFLVFESVQPKPEHHFVQGGGKKFKESHFAEGGEKGDKGYKGHHEAEKGSQGHHDRAKQHKEFAESGGHKKGFNHEDGYFAQQHQGHEGQKGYQFADKGHYAKGHHTKGRHNIHKLDEFKLNTDFFDEDLDEAFKEKHGGYEAKTGFKKGSQHGAGFFDKETQEGHHGKTGHFENGGFHFDEAGHKKASGLEAHHQNEEEFGKKGGEEGFNKFGYSHQVHH